MTRITATPAQKNCILNCLLNKHSYSDKQLYVVANLSKLAYNQNWFSRCMGYTVPHSLQNAVVKLLKAQGIEITELNCGKQLMELCEEYFGFEGTPANAQPNLLDKNVLSAYEVGQLIVSCNGETGHFTDVINKSENGTKLVSSKYSHYQVQELEMQEMPDTNLELEEIKQQFIQLKADIPKYITTIGEYVKGHQEEFRKWYYDNNAEDFKKKQCHRDFLQAFVNDKFATEFDDKFASRNVMGDLPELIKDVVLLKRFAIWNHEDTNGKISDDETRRKLIIENFSDRLKLLKIVAKNKDKFINFVNTHKTYSLMYLQMFAQENLELLTDYDFNKVWSDIINDNSKISEYATCGADLYVSMIDFYVKNNLRECSSWFGAFTDYNLEEFYSYCIKNIENPHHVRMIVVMFNCYKHYSIKDNILVNEKAVNSQIDRASVQKRSQIRAVPELLISRKNSSNKDELLENAINSYGNQNLFDSELVSRLMTAKSHVDRGFHSEFKAFDWVIENTSSKYVQEYTRGFHKLLASFFISSKGMGAFLANGRLDISGLKEWLGALGLIEYKDHNHQSNWISGQNIANQLTDGYFKNIRLSDINDEFPEVIFGSRFYQYSIDLDLLERNTAIIPHNRLMERGRQVIADTLHKVTDELNSAINTQAFDKIDWEDSVYTLQPFRLSKRFVENYLEKVLYLTDDEMAVIDKEWVAGGGQVLVKFKGGDSFFTLNRNNENVSEKITEINNKFQGTFDAPKECDWANHCLKKDKQLVAEELIAELLKSPNEVEIRGSPREVKITLAEITAIQNIVRRETNNFQEVVENQINSKNYIFVTKLTKYLPGLLSILGYNQQRWKEFLAIE